MTKQITELQKIKNMLAWAKREKSTNGKTVAYYEMMVKYHSNYGEYFDNRIGDFSNNDDGYTAKFEYHQKQLDKNFNELQLLKMVVKNVETEISTNDIQQHNEMGIHPVAPIELNGVVVSHGAYGNCVDGGEFCNKCGQNTFCTSPNKMVDDTDELTHVPCDFCGTPDVKIENTVIVCDENGCGIFKCTLCQLKPTQPQIFCNQCKNDICNCPDDLKCKLINGNGDDFMKCDNDTCFYFHNQTMDGCYWGECELHDNSEMYRKCENQCTQFPDCDRHKPHTPFMIDKTSCSVCGVCVDNNKIDGDNEYDFVCDDCQKQIHDDMKNSIFVKFKCPNYNYDCDKHMDNTDDNDDNNDYDNCPIPLIDCGTMETLNHFGIDLDETTHIYLYPKNLDLQKCIDIIENAWELFEHNHIGDKPKIDFKCNCDLFKCNCDYQHLITEYNIDKNVVEFFKIFCANCDGGDDIDYCGSYPLTHIEWLIEQQNKNGENHE